MVFYSACFFLGLIFTVLTAALGSLFNMDGIGGDGGLDLDLDMDIDVDLDAELPVSAESSGFDALQLFVLPMRPVIILPALTAFGGLGWHLMLKGMSFLMALIPALLAGYILGFIIDKLVVRVLKKMEFTSTTQNSDAVGTSATVVDAILEDGYGTITYSLNGNTLRAPAKSARNIRIDSGVKVVILKFDKHYCIVEIYEHFFNF